MKEECKLCKSKGFIFKNGGYTKSDRIQCRRCEGTGYVEEGTQNKSTNPNRSYGKYDGLEKLKDIEAV